MRPQSQFVRVQTVREQAGSAPCLLSRESERSACVPRVRIRVQAVQMQESQTGEFRKLEAEQAEGPSAATARVDVTDRLTNRESSFRRCQ